MTAMSQWLLYLSLIQIISFDCVDYSLFQMYIWKMLLRCWLGAQKQALTKLALQVKIYVMKMSDPCSGIHAYSCSRISKCVHLHNILY